MILDCQLQTKLYLRLTRMSGVFHRQRNIGEFHIEDMYPKLGKGHFEKVKLQYKYKCACYKAKCFKQLNIASNKLLFSEMSLLHSL